jgi:hypothetical protein
MHYEQRKISSGVKIGSADITQRQTPTINIKFLSDKIYIGSSVPLNDEGKVESKL